MKLLALLLTLCLCTETFSQSCDEANSLVSVRKRKTNRTEYVIFTLKNPVTSTTTIIDAQPPFVQDGSGVTVQISGCKYKQVVFKNIVWTCKTNIIPGSTYLIRQIKSTGQLEGVISYVIGYRCAALHVTNYEYQDGDYKKVVVRVKY